VVSNAPCTRTTSMAYAPSTPRGRPMAPPPSTLPAQQTPLSLAAGPPVNFPGSATYAEDGDITADLTWTSDIDSPIGTGRSVSVVLSDGVHTITASVTDSGGKTGSDSIGITMGTPPSEPTTASVDSVTYDVGGRKNRDLLITVALVDDLDNPVDGASVSIRIVDECGDSWVGSGNTGSDGTVRFQLRRAPSGSYTTTVSDVTASGLTWNGATQTNGYTK
jgi:hypothetical protein